MQSSHNSCFALSYYLNLGDNTYSSVKEILGEETYLKVILNRTLPGLDKEGYSEMKSRIYNL